LYNVASKNKNKKKKSGQAQAQKSVSADQQQAGSTTPAKASNSAAQKSSSTPQKSGSEAHKSGKTKTDIIGRLIGVVTLNRHIYREIAEDPAATMQAGIIVVIVAVLVGAVGYFAQANTSLPGLPATTPSLGRAIALAIGELVIWLAGGFVIAQVARYMFQASTNTSEMLRVFGFTRIFQLLFILGVFGGPIIAIFSIAGLVLSIIGSIIGIREAGEISTGKAVVTGVFAIVLVSIIVAFFVGFVLNPYMTMLLPT
jgi:hypothetical protein